MGNQTARVQRSAVERLEGVTLREALAFFAAELRVTPRFDIAAVVLRANTTQHKDIRAEAATEMRVTNCLSKKLDGPRAASPK